ncbi:MAG TPA: sulfite exporter TauE/SafE family protein [Pararobbsia sp.]|nr:sulfite exporter TauE/SafE family protein [Pararobbsia sp.]
MVFPHIDWLYSASGLGVGLLVGLTGVGGGSLMTPLLVLLFGVHPATAVGTDLLYAAVTKTAGTLAHGIQGSVDWRITGRLAAGSLPATIATLIALHHYGVHQRGSSGVIQAVLGVALLITAVSLIFRPQLTAFASRHAGELSESQAFGLTILVGAILGVLVSLTSVGAGAIGVTALLLLYPSLPTARIVGSDIAHAVPLTLVAGIGHWILGSVDGAMLLSLLIGSIPGIALGSYLSSRAPEALLRQILAATLLLVGGRLVFA